MLLKKRKTLPKNNILYKSTKIQRLKRVLPKKGTKGVHIHYESRSGLN